MIEEQEFLYEFVDNAKQRSLLKQGYESTNK